jgi:methylmalonyl-CoA mutase N-terminal domain/subunit
MYLAVAEQQGVPMSKVSGTIQNDILKEYVARGTYIYPPVPSMRLITDIFAYCGEHVPGWNTISISGYHIREAGSTAAQEVGFTLANGIAYVKAAMAAGLTVDTFAPQLSFFFNAHNDFFEEVAKFRAARRLWAKIMREQFGAKNPKSEMMRFHTQTGGSTLTAQQPMNNIVRVALQAFAAVCGGTQSLHTNSMDEALALPSQEAVTVALRTQQIIAHESGAAETVDPLAGSYYVEHLTNTIEQEARAYIDRIDAMGGSVRAIEQSYMQKEIQDSAYQYQRQIENGKRVIVGVNQFVVAEQPPTNLLRVNMSVQAAQLAKLVAVKQRRNQLEVDQTLAAVKVAAEGSANLMVPILAAVKAYATLQEICDVMREVFGEYQPSEEF